MMVVLDQLAQQRIKRTDQKLKILANWLQDSDTGIDSYADGTLEQAIKVAKQEVKQEIGDYLEEILNGDDEFVRYQLNKKWYFTSSPIISADWTKAKDEGWTVPVGGGLGYTFKIAKQPTQISIEAYYNAIKPSLAGEELLGDWTIRTQLQILFPRRAK